MNKVKLTVCVSTYNQEKVISECLDSLLSQATDFSWNIIISDDCSTDETLNIIRGYEKENSSRIRVIANENNKGPFLNYVGLHSQADGELVAHMDGDDVACERKLQTQVDYMDKNIECTICWHRMFFFDSQKEKIHPAINSEFTNKKIFVEELCYLGPFAPHSSTVYRRCNFNIDLFQEKSDDWLYSVYYINKGYGIMLNDVLGRYRISDESMSAGSVANETNRKLSTSSQMIAIKLYPHLTRDVATRALANFALDSIRFRPYSVLSLKVLIYGGVMPRISKMLKVFRFYRWSKLPNTFK